MGTMHNNYWHNEGKKEMKLVLLDKLKEKICKTFMEGNTDVAEALREVYDELDRF